MSCLAVIGGSGFIGTRLCEMQREAGKPFRIIDKRNSETFPADAIVTDVRQPEALLPALKGCDAIVNLAAERLR